MTISRAQATLARERIAEAGLADRVEVVERDFRELDGSYTAIASIAMLEAVGETLWRPSSGATWSSSSAGSCPAPTTRARRRPGSSGSR